MMSEELFQLPFALALVVLAVVSVISTNRERIHQSKHSHKHTHYTWLIMLCVLGFGMLVYGWVASRHGSLITAGACFVVTILIPELEREWDHYREP